MRPADVRLIASQCGERATYHKRRRWFSGALICVGNAWLRCTGSSLRALPTPRWQAWETALGYTLYGERIQAPSAKWLRLPAYPGRSLVDLLAGAASAAETETAVRAATIALRELHACTLAYPDGTARPLSHADAHAGNVIFDAKTGLARWIDFEAIHDPARPASWRQADDLRALAFSSAAAAGAPRFAAIGMGIVNYYDRPIVLRELLGIVRRVRQRPNPFHLGQARLTFGAHAQFCEVLERELIRYLGNLAERSCSRPLVSTASRY